MMNMLPYGCYWKLMSLLMVTYVSTAPLVPAPVSSTTNTVKAAPALVNKQILSLHHARPRSGQEQQQPTDQLISRNSKVVRGRTLEEIQLAESWLENFGYILPSGQSANVDDTEMRFTSALRKLQTYAKLPITGMLDTATVAKMREPRCGVKDFIPDGTRHKRYILLNVLWEREREIDIQFGNHTTDMTIEQQENIMNWAVEQWNNAANAQLVFHHDGDQVEFPEIVISHTRYDNKGRPFSPHGVLAYAALPREGDMFFDDTENWAEYHSVVPQRFSYKTVALHELGHSLGFAHSNVPSAVMYAFYGSTRHTLTDDDIAGAVALFGAN